MEAVPWGRQMARIANLNGRLKEANRRWKVGSNFIRFTEKLEPNKISSV